MTDRMLSEQLTGYLGMRTHASTSIIWCHMTNHECYFMGKAKYCG
jgi:hypothetical protein